MAQTRTYIDEKEKVASFDVDAQNTFTPLCPDELPVPEGDQIVSELNAQAKKTSLRVGSKDAHSAQAIWIANEQQPVFSTIKAEQADIAWPKHAVPGTKGFELIEGLPKITDYDFFIWKGVELDMHPYGACFHDLDENMSTGVIEFLKTKHMTTVIVGGLALDYCVKATVLQLLAHHFKVIVNKAASRGVDPDNSRLALEAMKEAGAILVESAEDIVNHHKRDEDFIPW